MPARVLRHRVPVRATGTWVVAPHQHRPLALEPVCEPWLDWCTRSLTASHLHCTAGSSRSFTAIRKDAGLCCGSRLWKGDVFAYVGHPQNLKDLKDKAQQGATRLSDLKCPCTSACTAMTGALAVSRGLLHKVQRFRRPHTQRLGASRRLLITGVPRS